MVGFFCFSNSWNYLVEAIGCCGKTSSQLVSPDTTTVRTAEWGWDELRDQIDHFDTYDLHDILRQPVKIEWCQWHLNIDTQNKGVRLSERFHQGFKKSMSSSSIAQKIDIIEKTFLQYMPDNNDWNEIRILFKQARQENSPLPILQTLSVSQTFSAGVNKHSAVNAYHSLKLYCTFLNCPIIAETQDYTDAFTSLFFHPKLDDFVVRNMTVYRGIVLENKNLIEGYTVGTIIITTTFLSTTLDPEIAKLYSGDPNLENRISIFCTYNINNTRRRTALAYQNSSSSNEKEVLILRYVPFKITSVEETHDGRTIKITFDECKDV